jgi:hypothetical protein
VSCPKDAPEPLTGQNPRCDTQRGGFAGHSSWFTGVPKVSELMHPLKSDRLPV